MKRTTGVYLFLALVGAAVLVSTSGAEAPRHPDVWLRNEQGDRISPLENRFDPYSPKKTCGSCHGYATITKGYHFQQGFDVMKDGFDRKRPWILSAGMYGKWLPYSGVGRLAAKKNRQRGEIDLSCYDWIGGREGSAPACGSCHPGGGPLEYGRTPEGRADLTRDLIQAEAAGGSPSDGDFSSRFSSDRLSHFRESGVVEADCLICHLPSYRMESRNEQLTARNYRWAATAGAGFGRVEGTVFGPRGWNFAHRPTVQYRWSDRRFFAADGRLKGTIVSRGVGARNCLQCHGGWEAKDTGTIASSDAHIKAGLTCTDCHPLVGATAEERLRHQIAKGSHPQLSVRDDLDGVGILTCIGCHKEGRYHPTRTGMPKTAPNPDKRHAERFPQVNFHFTAITCNGCHMTLQPARGLAILDLSTGIERGLTADRLEWVASPAAYAVTSSTPWPPWIKRASPAKGKEEVYLPHVPKRIIWFGERKAGGIQPIALRHVREAYLRLGRTSQDEKAGGTEREVKAILSDEEIIRMIESLTHAGFREVVYLADRIYSLSRGRLKAEKDALPADSYPVVHGLVLRDQTYGARGNPEGCMDCHAEKAPFFKKPEIRNVRDFLKNYPDVEGHVVPQMNDWGMDSVPSFQ
ncbi:MAG: cytochrome c3 family protein [Smithellaceae bacterium]|nr:cytochrome c3 family protein [Smithellaceae bacterium]